MEAEESATLRKAFRELPDVAAQESLQPPGSGALYVPASHTNALSLDTTVVVGMRGAGKSVWTAALLDVDTRQRLVRAGAPSSLEQTHVQVGYSVDPAEGKHPSKDVLQNLIAAGFEPRHIWSAVLARKLAENSELPLPPSKRWSETVAWVKQDPEAFEQLLAQCAQTLKSQGKNFLLVFDSMDTTVPGKWRDVRSLARGALEVALMCRPYSNIRLKFFMRPDMEEDPEITDFRDASKLMHNKVELMWRPVDLYGLVFHVLANGAAGRQFRTLVSQSTGLEWSQSDSAYQLPASLRSTSDAQWQVIDTLAGPYMGTNKRRGYTYTWIPLHLADAFGRVAPRSLLLALRTAAEITEEEYPVGQPLHYEGIKRGVAQASEVRVAELSKEDYPWVTPLLRALRGLTVPLDLTDVKRRWTKTVRDSAIGACSDKLPPRRYSSVNAPRQTTDLLIDDLVELGVVYRTGDNRLNIPDIFRVGFEIRRKGGVRPPVPST